MLVQLSIVRAYAIIYLYIHYFIFYMAILDWLIICNFKFVVIRVNSSQLDTLYLTIPRSTMKYFVNTIYITCMAISFTSLGLFRPGYGKDLPELKEANFDNVVNGSNFVFVIFYAPWNELSVKAVKTLEQVSEEIGNSGVVVAKVNAYDEVKLATRFWIDRWPVFKFFIKGSVTPET